MIAFAGDVLSIILRIEQATRGQRRLDRPVEISAKYTVEATPDGPHLIRSGKLAVEYIKSDSTDRLDFSEEEFRTFLARKFSGVFLSELYFDGLMPPEGGSWGKLRRLNLTQLSSRDGWLAIGYQLSAGSTVASAPTFDRAR